MLLRRRVLGAASGCLRASYYADPVPTLTREAFEAQVAAAKSPRALAKALRGKKGTRNWLSEHEQVVFGKARRSGVLELERGCSKNVVDQFERWCYQERRPFLAVNVHGDKLFVDAHPAGGFGEDVDEGRVDALVASATEEVAGLSGKVVLFDPDASSDAVAAAEEEKTTSVEVGKPALLSGAQARFVVSGTGRGDVLGLAKRLFDRWAGVSGVPTAADVHQAKVDRAMRRAWRREEIHRLVLRKARDRMPEVRFNLPKHAFDAFSRAEEQGTDVSTRGPRLPFRRSHYFDRTGRLRKGVRDPQYAFLLEQARKEALQDTDSERA